MAPLPAVQTSRSNRHFRKHLGHSKTFRGHLDCHCFLIFAHSTHIMAHSDTWMQVPIDITILTTFCLFFTSATSPSLILFACMIGLLCPARSRTLGSTAWGQ